jgi:hypothetical protein
MTGFEMVDPVDELESWLVQELSGVEPYLERAREAEGEPTSEYWLFAYVVAPYLTEGLESGDEARLRGAWSALDRIVFEGPPSARNELLVVALEELDMASFAGYLGEGIAEAWFENVCWYPSQGNEHIDVGRYRSRWRDEIEDIGGFEALSPEAEVRIRSRLIGEFKIRDLQARVGDPE